MSRLPGPRSPLALARLGRLALTDLPAAVLALRDRYGEVVDFGFGPTRFVYLFGRDANELLLSTEAGRVRWGEAFEPLRFVDGDTAIVLSDGEEHRRRRRLVQPAFSKRRIDSYLPIIIEEADRTIDGFSPGDEVDLHAAWRDTIRRIVVRTLFGDGLAARSDDLGRHLLTAVAWVNRNPLARFEHDWPGLPYRKALRAREAADRIVYEEIDRRRRHIAEGGEPGDDALGALLTAGDGDDDPLTDAEVRDQIVSLVAAGFDTTSGALGWASAAVLTEPGVRDALVDELEGRLGDDRISVESIPDLAYLDGVVAETLRRWAPGPVAPRHVVEPLTYRGHTVEAGRNVLYSAHATHHDPDLWPDPFAFRPERWNPDDPSAPDPPEDPYAFVPFGGGARRCLGFALATLEMKVVLSRFFRRVECVPEFTERRSTGIATLSPRGGVPVAISTVSER